MNDLQNDLALLQTGLGYQFKDQALLTRALTHRSRRGGNNERLEYLGDSVLGFVMSDALFVRFPEAREGELTRMRARLVCRETLVAQARRLSLGRHLLLGDSTLKSGGHDAILADTLEAVIGAVYLDSDLPQIKGILLKLFEPQLAQISPQSPKDYKTRLQERLQKHGMPLPVYEVVEQSGKPHAATFTVVCKASGLAPATASGGTRRSAEQRAAREVLAIIEGDG